MATFGVFSENFKKLFFSIRAGLKITIRPNVPAIYANAIFRSPLNEG